MHYKEKMAQKQAVLKGKLTIEIYNLKRCKLIIKILHKRNTAFVDVINEKRLKTTIIVDELLHPAYDDYNVVSPKDDYHKQREGRDAEN